MRFIFFGGETNNIYLQHCSLFHDVHIVKNTINQRILNSNFCSFSILIFMQKKSKKPGITRKTAALAIKEK